MIFLLLCISFGLCASEKPQHDTSYAHLDSIVNMSKIARVSLLYEIQQNIKIIKDRMDYLNEYLCMKNPSEDIRLEYARLQEDKADLQAGYHRLAQRIREQNK